MLWEHEPQASVSIAFSSFRVFSIFRVFPLLFRVFELFRFFSLYPSMPVSLTEKHHVHVFYFF